MWGFFLLSLIFPSFFEKKEAKKLPEFLGIGVGVSVFSYFLFGDGRLGFLRKKTVGHIRNDGFWFYLKSYGVPLTMP